MSDSDFVSASRRLPCADLNDESWAKDSLSDDEIDVPKDILFDELNEDEDDDEEESGVVLSTSEIWGDLGLDRFLQELTSLNAIQSQLEPLGLTRGQMSSASSNGNGTTSGSAASGSSPTGAQVQAQAQTQTANPR
jgi:hypothetical protein